MKSRKLTKAEEADLNTADQIEKFGKELLSQAMSEIGSKGGKAGTGKSKVRGDSDYYRKIRAGKKGGAK